MKKFIRASRKDDLLKEKAAWQMKYDARKTLYDGQERKYNEARWAWEDNLEALITETFKSYIDKLPGLTIKADRGWGNIEINFNYEDRWNTPREEKSLLWSYDVRLRENGEIVKESNSWSGFQAVTSQQIDDLMNSANFLKAIVEFDWAPLLEEAKRTEPKYSQYIGIRDPNHDPEYADPGYDRMIKEAEISEAVGTNKWLKVDNGYNRDSWVNIVSETPKFYNVIEISDWYLNYYGQDELRNFFNNTHSTYRVKKDNIKFVTPIVALTPDELIAKGKPSAN